MLNKKISISFICCVKNESLYISKMINTIIESSPDFLEWELILIDDNSDDNTFDLVSKKYRSYHQIKIHRNSGSGKVSGTYDGLKRCKGEWIKFLDGDDYVSFDSLNFDDFKCDAFYHNYARFGKTKKNVNISNSLSKNQELWKYELRSIPKAMYFAKKSIFKNLEGFNECIFEDLYINQNIQRYAKKINKVDKLLYFYRQHENNFYGDSFFGDRVKIIRMGRRIENMIKVLDIYFPDDHFNSSLNDYCIFLQKFSLIRLLRLIKSPKLFSKAVYYYLISKI